MKLNTPLFIKPAAELEPDIPGGLVFYAGPDNKTLRREDDEILVIIRAIMGDN